MHFTLAKKGGFVYAPQAERQNDSVALRQPRYGFGTNFADKAAVFPTVEIVIQQHLLAVHARRANDVLVCDVRLEIGRQISAVYKPFAALFYVFEQIADGLNDFVFAYRLEIVSPEPP